VPDAHTQSYERALRNYAASPLARIAATLAIVVGTLIVGFNPDRWDYVVMGLPRGHGIHLHELIGVVFIAAGIAVFWHSSVPTAE
jgi:uncharacterized protein YjeT (DUF2065 family)